MTNPSLSGRGAALHSQRRDAEEAHHPARPRLGAARVFAEKPVAIIDIGSNSVRLVVYSGATRIPSIIFNEKVLAGLGRERRRDRRGGARRARWPRSTASAS